MENYEYLPKESTASLAAPQTRRRGVARKPALASASTERGRFKALLARGRLIEESIPADSPRRKVSLAPVRLPPLEEGTP
jgi:hypothetical protein